MATVLLLIIYIAFIGLGVPDALFGTAWPVLYVEFHLPLAAASYVTLLINACTMLSSLLSARVINRFGVGAVTAVSTALTALGLLGFALPQSLLWLCLFAVPLGFGAGAVDAALNNYVALHYKAVHMNFLHCFYGIGVMISPFLMASSLSGPAGWRGGYRAALALQLCITAVLFAALPLWRRARWHEETAFAETIVPQTLSMRQMLHMPAVRMAWLVFLGACAIEVTCGTWGSTYLVAARGLGADAAARAVMLYYMGMALGRFLSGMLARRLTPWQLVRLGEAGILAACPLLALPLPASCAAAGLFLAGLGVGPIYPNMTHLTPRNFGEDLSQSVISSQMAAAYVGVMAVPPLYGLLAQAVGAWVLPWFILALLAATAWATLRLPGMLAGKR